jgi:hypothetical protein
MKANEVSLNFCNIPGIKRNISMACWAEQALDRGSDHLSFSSGVAGAALLIVGLRRDL